MSNNFENTAELDDYEEEISIRQIVTTLKRHKLVIFLSTLLVTIAAIFYSYFIPPSYSSKILIKLESGKNSQQQTQGFVDEAMGKGSVNMEDEIAILETRNLLEKAINRLDLKTRYFSKKDYKTQEYYKNSPFIVTIKEFNSIMLDNKFTIRPVNKERFRLVIEDPLSEDASGQFPLPYDEEFTYGELIETPWFAFTVQNLFAFEEMTYSFMIMSDNSLFTFVRDGLSIQSKSEQGNILQLTFTGNTQQRPKDILDAIAETYIQASLDLKRDNARETLGFLDAQLSEMNAKLRVSEEKLDSYKKANTITDISEKASLASKKISNLESKLYEINMQKAITENILSYIYENEDQTTINISATQIEQGGLDQIIENLNDANSKLVELGANYTSFHPDYVKQQREVSNLIETLIRTLESNLRNLNKQISELEQVIERKNASLRTLPETERELSTLSRDHMVVEKLYAILLEKRAEATVVESSKVLDIRVIEPATMEEEPFRSHASLFILAGMIIGLILGVVLSFVLEFLDDSVKEIEDIEKRTKIPVYGVLPQRDEKKVDDHIFNEGMLVISNNVEFMKSESDTKLITITSSVASEGKSTIISELAKIFASNGRKTIILDMDLRKASLHDKLKLDNELGMSDLLMGEKSLGEVTQSTKYDNLDVITAGRLPSNPMRLILSEELKNVTEGLLIQYDYVLIDAPPVGLVADAMALMRMADLTLIALKANYSKKEFIDDINRFVKDENINPGIVLNGVKEQGHYGYGYGKGYGKRYGGNYYGASN